MDEEVSFMGKIIKQGARQRFINIPSLMHDVIENQIGGVGTIVKVTLERVENRRAKKGNASG